MQQSPQLPSSVTFVPRLVSLRGRDGIRRRRWSRSLYFAVSCCAFAGNANADSQNQAFVPIAGFAPSSIVFDEAGGHYDRWKKDLPCNANRATVMVKFDRTNFDTKWPPLAKIQLNPVLDTTKAPAVYAIGAATIMGPWWPHIAASYAEHLTRDSVHGRQEAYFGNTAVDVSRPDRIDLAWTTIGAVTVTFNGTKTLRVAPIGPITSIAVFVSSAKFEFLNLKIGQAGLVGKNSSCIS
jgi:hypothetical protein